MIELCELVKLLEALPCQSQELLDGIELADCHERVPVFVKPEIVIQKLCGSRSQALSSRPDIRVGHHNRAIQDFTREELFDQAFLGLDYRNLELNYVKLCTQE